MKRLMHRWRLLHVGAWAGTLLLVVALAAPGAAQDLVSVGAEAQLTGTPGRALAVARGHHFVIDAPPPLGGPNEALNPIEALLASLATCGVLVSEKVAREEDIALSAARGRAEGDLDPRGVRGEAVDPRIQVFRVYLDLAGPTKAEAERLEQAIRSRCPIYTTLERAAPIEMHTSVQAP